MNLHSIFGFLCAFLLLAGCSSRPVVSDTCKNIDWFEKGRRHGGSGLKRNPLAGLKCPLSGDSRIAYETGYNRGLTEFCTPANGMAMGRSGQVTEGSCPGNSGFEESYHVGIEIFELRKEQEMLQSQIDSLFRLLTVQNLSDLERDTLQEQLSALENQQASINQRLGKLRSQSTN